MYCIKKVITVVIAAPSEAEGLCPVHPLQYGMIRAVTAAARSPILTFAVGAQLVSLDGTPAVVPTIVDGGAGKVGASDDISFPPCESETIKQRGARQGLLVLP